MISVTHRNGAYPVHFRSVSEAIADFPPDSFIITDENVRRFLSVPWPATPTLVLPPGEITKSLGSLEQCASWLAEAGASRKSTVVALGGGVIGDLAGFVASTYMRGIDHIQIPTTLLAQVDSSVGGKVAVDLPQGKNLVGAFHPPVSVTIDPGLLQTLPKRQMDNGMAEVWKYAFIAKPDLEPRLESGTDLALVIHDCISIKAEIVAKDEFETNGQRATLNFGHTVGHAIERLTGYGTVLHGEAISIGMVIEARLGEILGVSQIGVAAHVRSKLLGQGLPVEIPNGLSAESLILAMGGDKKTSAGKLAFSLLGDIGECKLYPDVAESYVRAAIEER